MRKTNNRYEVLLNSLAIILIDYKLIIVIFFPLLDYIQAKISIILTCQTLMKFDLHTIY